MPTALLAPFGDLVWQPKLLQEAGGPPGAACERANCARRARGRLRKAEGRDPDRLQCNEAEGELQRLQGARRLRQDEVCRGKLGRRVGARCFTEP